MTHEEEMEVLRAETARLREENDKMQAKIVQQIKDINAYIRGL